MAYPEKLLADDEKVVEHLHPHWITVVRGTLWFLLFCALGGAGIALVANHQDGTAQQVLISIIVVIGLGFIARLTVGPWITWRCSHYVFTTHRVLIRRGVLHHTGRDISLQRISDVAFSRTLWDRIVGAGTLTIESAGEHGQETLTNVPHSDQAQQTLNRLVEQDADRRTRGAMGGFPPPPNPGQVPPGYQQPPSGYQQYPPTSPYPPQ